MEMKLSTEDYDEIADRLFERIATRLPPAMSVVGQRNRKRLNLKQAAEYLNISDTTLYRWRETKPKLKRLEHLDGANSYFLSDELDDYLEQSN